ncbi:hypothetical protein L0337_04225 [candidate division KSB1 bacterium]|nr:hypothetical protein [candidate division KSB1 bacterium]
MCLQKFSKITVGAVVISMLAGLAVAAAGGPYKLAYRMKKGQRLNYRMTMTVDQSMEMHGNEMNSNIDGATALHVEVEEVGKEGNITFVYALDSLRTHVKSPQMDSTFRNPEELIGKRNRQTISVLGKKIKSEVVDSVNLSGMLAQAGIGRQSSFQLIELPEKEVRIGDSWTTSQMDTSKQGNLKIVSTPNATYTVAGEVDTLGFKCLRLTYKGTLKIKGEGTQMGMNLFFEGEGPVAGTAYFAPTEGLLVGVISDLNLEATIALTGQMSMTIPQSTSTKTAIVLVK